MQTISRFIGFLLVLIICSCQQPNAQLAGKPAAELLDKPTFALMIKELQLIEAHKNLLRATNDTNPPGYWKQVYAEAFARVGVRKSAFDSTFLFYQLAKPRELHQLYEALTNELIEDISKNNNNIE